MPNTKIAELPPLDEEARDDASYRGQDRAWSSLVALFNHYRETEGLTYEALGQRIGRRRSQVQRWLGSSFNMNLKSFGLLAEGLDADMVIELRPRTEAPQGQNYCHPREAARASQEANQFRTVATFASKSISLPGAAAKPVAHNQLTRLPTPQELVP